LTTPSITCPLRGLHQFLALLGAGLFQNRAARHHDVAAAAIHLRIWNGCELFIRGADVADRTDVDLRARQEGNGAVEVDGEPPLTWLKMTL